MVGMELVRDRHKTPADVEGKKDQRFLSRKWVLPGLGGFYGNVLRIQPPLVITEEELPEVLKILNSAFTSILNDPSSSTTEVKEGTTGG